MNQNEDYFVLNYIKGHGDSFGNNLANKEAQRVLNDNLDEDTVAICDKHHVCKNAYLRLITSILNNFSYTEKILLTEQLSKEDEKFAHILKHIK
jgi:hypothetical protein